MNTTSKPVDNPVDKSVDNFCKLCGHIQLIEKQDHPDGSKTEYLQCINCQAISDIWNVEPQHQEQEEQDNEENT